MVLAKDVEDLRHAAFRAAEGIHVYSQTHGGRRFLYRAVRHASSVLTACRRK